jgi:hypothetical protein
MLNGFLRFVTFGRSKSHAVTIGGWTPGIRFLAAGHPLSCGCLAGIYHTLSKDVAEIIDAPANECPYRHDRNLVLWRRAIDERLEAVDVRANVVERLGFIGAAVDAQRQRRCLSSVLPLA